MTRPRGRTPGPPRARATTVLGALLTVVAACTAPDPAEDLAAWSVDPEPLASIGLVDGAEPYLFETIVDAALLPDGRIVVADGGPGVIRIFDAGGRFEAELGGTGEGPGEFTGLRNVWLLPGDSILAWDAELHRLTWFALDGGPVRTRSLRLSDEASGVGNLDIAVGPLSDGSIALASMAPANRDRDGADRVSVERFSMEGEHLGRVTDVTGLVRFRIGDRGSAPIPFSPYPRFDTRNRSVYFTDGASARVFVWTDGTADVLDFPRTEHDLQAAWDALPDRLRASAGDMAADLVAVAPRPDSLPQLAGLLVADDGGVWTRNYRPLQDALGLSGGRAFGGRWWVAGPEGTLVATVELPDGLTPLDVRGDRLLGLAVDALGVERVRLHRLERGVDGGA